MQHCAGNGRFRVIEVPIHIGAVDAQECGEYNNYQNTDRCEDDTDISDPVMLLAGELKVDYLQFL